MHFLSLCFYSILEFVSSGGLFEQGSELGGKDGGRHWGGGIQPVMADSLMVGQRGLS